MDRVLSTYVMDVLLVDLVGLMSVNGRQTRTVTYPNR